MDDTEEEKALSGIIVGVDGSPLSIEALRWAARLEPTVGGPITAVTVWQYPMALGQYPGMEWNPEDDARELLKRSLEEAYGDQRPAGLATLIATGPAAHVLIDNSRNARLLIVGSRGLGGFMGLLLGSVSAACAEHANCPVLVVHAPEDSVAGPADSKAETVGTASA